MAEPTVGDLSTMTSQFYDLDIISAAGATVAAPTTPTSTAQHYWRGLSVTVAGTLIIDTLGLGGSGGKTSQTVSFPAGTTQLAIVQVRAGGTATGITGLY